MVSEDKRLKAYEWIWTTHADEFYLLRLENPQILVIVRITKTTSGGLLIEDSEDYTGVKQKMLEAGIPVIDLEEYRRLKLQRRNPKIST